MSVQLVRQAYGKSKVRVARVLREGDRHEIVERTVWISLDGDFGAAYTAADNSKVIPTDTMKNTVYVLARDAEFRTIESFGRLLAKHFLDEFAHIASATVTIEQRQWDRIPQEGNETGHPHSFVDGGPEKQWCELEATREGETLRSGVRDLRVMKTTASGFSHFLRDKYTTLADTDDRIFATTIEATWTCREADADWQSARQEIRQAMLDVFVERYSPSVQATLYEMAKAALKICPAIDDVSLALPNQHYILADLSPFDMENPNEVFVPIDAPHGQISATIRREG